MVKTPASLVLENVSHVFRQGPRDEGVWAVRNLNLTIPQGEFFAVIGPSGCGKSTLMDICAGILAAAEGNVSFDGKPIRGVVPDGVGIVFQEDASFPWLSVWENVAFGLRRRGIDSSEISRVVDNALQLTGLRQFADHRPRQLSGGMRQRVCIARTLVLQPRLILMDEPFGALDEQTRLLMGEELLRLWRETGATVLLITHSLDEAAMLADRVGIMSARPGRFIDTITTGWPRERDSKIVSDPHFGQVTGRLWENLREESLKALNNQELSIVPNSPTIGLEP